MGCVASSPHSRRKYRDLEDFDEVIVPLRYFGNFRNGSVAVPDDIDGLPSTQIEEHLAGNVEPILYEADLDQGYGYRCCRPINVVCFSFPAFWVAVAAFHGAGAVLKKCTCDEMCMWTRKEYSTRSFYRVYTNRIEVNQPTIRCPWGLLGCGSWNADTILTHPFDRGAFGFRPVPVGDASHLCCIWPVYGGTVARQRCQCNGSLCTRMSDCGGWWCDEWICDMLFCSYRYTGIADPEEVSFVSSIALQAYFEGRPIAPEDMQKCIEYWKKNISQKGDPEGRKRDVCCEPYCVPLPTCTACYHFTHPERNIPYDEDDELNTTEMKEVYADYAVLRNKQLEAWKSYHGPVKYSTVCRACGCRRFCGRNGFVFCFEGCCSPCHKKGEPAPPFYHRDIDDDNDASVVLGRVLGDPPANVVYRRWEFDEERGENAVVTIQANLDEKKRDIEEGLVNSAEEDEQMENKPHVE